MSDEKGNRDSCSFTVHLVNPETSINAGRDTAICASVNEVLLDGSRNGSQGDIVWRTLGSGIFSDSSCKRTENSNDTEECEKDHRTVHGCNKLRAGTFINRLVSKVVREKCCYDSHCREHSEGSHGGNHTGGHSVISFFYACHYSCGIRC